MGASANQIRTLITLAVSPIFSIFHQQAVGTTSAPLTVTLTNDSNETVSVTAVQSSIPQFAYSGPALPVTLSARQTLHALVTFTPAAAREYSGVLTFTLSTGSRTTVDVSGSGVKQTAANPPVTAPAITSNPASKTVTAGQTAMFSVVATGTAPMTYQWKMNGAAISGATSASYTTAAATTTNSGETFSAAVSNSAGSATSSSATLTVNAATVAPAITSNPASQTITAGQTATFSIAATGTAPMTYQWKMNGASISGATSASYTTAVTTTANSGETFSAAVSNSAGSASSNSAVLTVNPAVVAPAVTSNPASQAITAGQTATFSIAATGTAPMTYQWKMNGASISGATSASYTTAVTTTANSGETFSATVSNSAGSATSNGAALTVNPIATMLLNSNPSSLNFGSVAMGSDGVLSVTLTNSGNSTVTVSNVSISGSGFTPSGVST
ncbi:MAG: choice-of-anchor D domain-containing protein, partial [Candidatus Acidiferrales bacterium]